MTPATSQPRAYWLRAWQITIGTPQGDYTITNDQPGNESLRIRFGTDQLILSEAGWTADLTIYNLSTTTSSGIQKGTPSASNPWVAGQSLAMGTTVSISAGYQYTGSGAFNATTQQIYFGRVFQSLSTRENVTDYKLTLRCINMLFEGILNFTNLTIGPGTDDYNTIVQVLGSAKNPVTLGPVDAGAMAALTMTKHPKAQTFFDRPLGIVQRICRHHKLYSWIDNQQQLNIRSYNAAAFQQAPAYAYGPPNAPGAYAPAGTITGQVKKTLIGTPQQTQQGVIFRVLLDASVNVGDIVQLAPGTLINPANLQFGQSGTPPAPLNPAGIYAVGGIHHEGDSRGKGDDWYTEIIAMNQGYFAGFLQSRTPS